MYLLKRATDAKTRFSTYGHPRESPWFFLSWSLGRPFDQDIPTPIVYIQAQSGGGRSEPLKDMLFTVAGQFLISKRFYALIRNFSSCMKAYPSVVQYKGETISDDYVSVNFERSFSCMDWRKSRYDICASEGLTTFAEHAPGEPSPRDREIRIGEKAASTDYVGRVTRLALDESQIPEGEDILRLKEQGTLLVVTERLKTDAEANALTGIEFLDFRDKHLL